jgi:hypothetical protein
VVRIFSCGPRLSTTDRVFWAVEGFVVLSLAGLLGFK